jgi:hypothetical protein
MMSLGIQHTYRLASDVAQSLRTTTLERKEDPVLVLSIFAWTYEMVPRVCSQDSSPAIVLVGTSQWFGIVLAGRPRHGKRAPSGTGHSHELVGGKIMDWVSRHCPKTSGSFLMSSFVRIQFARP